jgi:glycogen operon protein
MLGYCPISSREDLSFSRLNSAPYVPKCIVVDDSDFDWNGDEKPKIPWSEEVIYETHVKSFTARNPLVDKALRGTCAGMATKGVVDYLKSLHISSVELLPTAAFMTNGFLLDKKLTNYWGYDPIAFMAPHAPYLSARHLSELKHMVRVFHEAGIEVILDVVYNHTGEGNHMGQTLCYRGIDNAVYYRLNKENPRFYDDTTGCGNSFNLDHPRVLQLVMDSLRYWADNMHIDGFRFDLATTLARDDNNQYTINSDFLATVQQDPTLQRLKLIAEPWDLGWGGYQVGSFRPGWAEWNDKFRDVVRRFWKGDFGQASEFASRWTGSSDVYDNRGRRPWESVNFITAHDGFTLWDLVSYNDKHNEANGEENRDGNNANYSWNSGVEGPTDDEAIQHLRLNRAKSMMASLLLSFGTPMMRGGDELCQTSHGNNNTYAQDNDYSWLKWDDISVAGHNMLAFVEQVMAFRRRYASVWNDDFLTPETCIWMRPDGTPMQSTDWEVYVRALACRIRNTDKKSALFFVFNATENEMDWRLPEGKWKIALDTSDRAVQNKQILKLQPWSVVVLIEEEKV